MVGPRQAVVPSSLSFSRRSKSSSKSKRDLDRVASSLTEAALLNPNGNWTRASSDRLESDSRCPGAAQVEVASKTDIVSISPARSASNNSSRLSTNLSRSLHRFGVEGSSFLELARWPLKPPDPLATQIQKPKTNVAPSSSTVLVKLKDAIEFFGGCSMNTPTWRARC
jgi:hypothetical protein